MRLLAWTPWFPGSKPNPRDGGKALVVPQDQFRCREQCHDGARWIAERRCGKNCTLPGFQGRWTGSLWHSAHVTWYGREEVLDPTLPRHPERLAALGPGGPSYPSEDPGEGCQGGWVRCRWVESFIRYRRQRTRDGGRTHNPALDGVSDPLILEALAYYEYQEAAAVARFEEAAFG